MAKLVFVKTLSVILFLELGASCSSNKTEHIEENRIIKKMSDFNTQLIKENNTGMGLPFSSFKNYNSYVKGELNPMELKEAAEYVGEITMNHAYYPIAHLEYVTPKIDIYLIIENVNDKISSLHTSVYKDGIYKDDIDIWKLAAIDKISEIHSSVYLDKGVVKGGPYIIEVFSNAFSQGYYAVNITPEGEIEIQEILVEEGETP